MLRANGFLIPFERKALSRQLTAADLVQYRG